MCDPVSLDTRLHEPSVGAQEARDAARLPTTETPPTGYWANQPKFMVSYLKSMYGDAATLDNDWGYEWHPKILGDHSHRDHGGDGRWEGQGDVLRGTESGDIAQRHGAARGDAEARVAGREGQLAHRDRDVLEERPEITNGEVNAADIATEVFFFPAQVGEYEAASRTLSACCSGTPRQPIHRVTAGRIRGSITSSESDSRRNAQRAESARHRVQESRLGLRTGSATPASPQNAGEPDALKILREINGFQTGDPSQHLTGFAAEGRRLDDLRVVDLLRRLSRPIATCRPGATRSTGRTGRAPQLGRAGRRIVA